ncbi:MAG: tRNA (N6-threonylcarbamoyladenosine(37)-N6)-methyltransferase TrmO [Candidatus Wukongarchaeota archaeon]|nr:tRNA (N6-threonylcarbamoyladenosine(37)-N6)-methyltransferase TrmO [Candidatus Wukongarchaeota archaeon]MDO8129238.1 tRNA (N6-threonylcarbamoyladenosine(37)-N6)-methyltransferase TrmO [Candidatus Wukongarchaeota archaeon]
MLNLEKEKVYPIGYVAKVWDEEKAKIKIKKEFAEGFERIEEFSHLIILYWFHLRDNSEHRTVLKVHPKRHPDAPIVGVFSSRSPSRPNPIGLCIVKILEIGRNYEYIDVEGLDALEDSPIIDIKPYIPLRDTIPKATIPHWLKKQTDNNRNPEKYL